MSLTPRLDRLENNKIINGNFDFWQRGTSFTGLEGYGADRFRAVTSAGLANPDIDRSTDVPTLVESGFKSTYSMLWTSTAAETPLTAEAYRIDYRMEGLDTVSLIGKDVTLSFWIKSNKPGTYSVAFKNNTLSRSYIVEYTIDTTNTWEKKSVTVPIEIDTWVETNALSLIVKFPFASGPDRQGSVGTWLAGDLETTSNTENGADAIGNEFRIAQVMLNEGDQAGSFSRAGRTVQEELQLCQRYYEVIPFTRWRATVASGTAEFQHVFQTSKRALPVIVNTTGSNIGFGAESVHSVRVTISANAANGSFDADAEL